MIINFPIPRSHLRACLLTAGVHDIRYYLNGLLLEVYPDRAFVVGTDGPRMTICRSTYKEPLTAIPADGLQIIVPREICKVKRDNKPAQISYDTERVMVSVTDGMVTLSARAIEGKYTKWRQVIPEKSSGVTGHFNVAYTATLKAQATEFGIQASACVLFHNGPNGAALVTFDYAHSCIGVIMPMRVSSTAPDARTLFAAPEISEPVVETPEEPPAKVPAKRKKKATA